MSIVSHRKTNSPLMSVGLENGNEKKLAITTKGLWQCVQNPILVVATVLCLCILGSMAYTQFTGIPPTATPHIRGGVAQRMSPLERYRRMNVKHWTNGDHPKPYMPMAG